MSSSSSSSSFCSCYSMNHRSNKITDCDPISSSLLDEFHSFRSSFDQKYHTLPPSFQIGFKFQEDESFWKQKKSVLKWDPDLLQNEWIEAKESLSGCGKGIFAKKCIPHHAYPSSCSEEIFSRLYEYRNFRSQDIQKHWSFQNDQAKPLCLGHYNGMIVGRLDLNSGSSSNEILSSHNPAYSILLDDQWIVSTSTDETAAHWSQLLNHSRNYANLFIDERLLIWQKAEIVKGSELLWDYGSDYWLFHLTGRETVESFKKTKSVDVWQRIFNLSENYTPFLQWKEILHDLSEIHQINLLETLFRENFSVITHPPKGFSKTI